MGGDDGDLGERSVVGDPGEVDAAAAGVGVVGVLPDVASALMADPLGREDAVEGLVVGIEVGDGAGGDKALNESGDLGISKALDGTAAGDSGGAEDVALADAAILGEASHES